MVTTKPRAVVLLSGGLDSTTTLAVAKAEGFDVFAISFRYGQRHSVELDSAQRIADAACVQRHIVVDIDPRHFGGSALTADIAVPKGRIWDELAPIMDKVGIIPEPAFDDPANRGKGVINLNGKMTELLHLEEARRILAIAHSIDRDPNIKL